LSSYHSGTGKQGYRPDYAFTVFPESVTIINDNKDGFTNGEQRELMDGKLHQSGNRRLRTGQVSIDNIPWRFSASLLGEAGIAFRVLVLTL
ncbi:hypothetical protein, partial [Faecalibaculum rodentium]|uniref:hypothetical protein n=1 Tax=Faecalibaculum rodentium TaxID=1702221 RepID=UPI002627D678